MAGWAGWGAGPAGAGASGGPSRFFLGALLVGCAAVAIYLALDGKLPQAGVAGCAAAYFALRLFGGLGRETR